MPTKVAHFQRLSGLRLGVRVTGGNEGVHDLAPRWLRRESTADEPTRVAVE
jgi:hypothetical protein